MRSVQCENHTAYKFAILILGLFGRNTFLLEKYSGIYLHMVHTCFFSLT
jgi:hypothetical protein